MVLSSATAALVAAPAFATAARLGGYKGDDVGFLIMSITTQGLTQQYVLRLSYRLVGAKANDMLIGGVKVLPLSKHDIQTSHSKLHGLTNFLMLTDDSDESEQGDVLIESLKPGRYEIFNADSFYSNGLSEHTSKLKNDISMPFEIKPGRATYLGEFKALAVYGHNLFGMSVPAGARYIVTDQNERDLIIAKRKNKAITETDIAVPNVDALNNPDFSSKL